MFWEKKLVKRQKYHHQKLGSAEKGSRSPAPPKYAPEQEH